MRTPRLVRSLATFALGSLATISIARSDDSPRLVNPTPEVIHADADIAFYSDRTGDLEIFSMNTDGAGVVNLTHNPALDIVPSWSGDGTKIAFVSTRDGTRQIYVMDSD